MTGYLVPCPPFVKPTVTATAKAATATLTAAECHGQQITNTGAADTIVLTLPAVSTCAGTAFRVQITVAQIVQITPASGEKIYLGGSGVASKYLEIAGTIGHYANIFCDGTQWMVTRYNGVLTKEA